jgi:ABC-2 type transport system ATP-binding protein
MLFGGEAASRKLSARIGYLPEERGLYKKMRVGEHLTFLGEAKGIARSVARRKAGAWLERLGISDWTLKKVEELSKGMQQKVQFIGALLHDPDLLLLDEPFSGLDPVNSQVMKDVVVEQARGGKTVLFSTHIMEQAERCAIARHRTRPEGTDPWRAKNWGRQHSAHLHAKWRPRGPRPERPIAGRARDDYGASAEVSLVA